MNSSYTLLRTNVLELIEQKPSLDILDVGCSTGVNGAFLRERMGATVFGVDYEESYCRQAESRLARVFHADLNRVPLSGLPFGRRFDYVLFSDILEHLMMPWEALRDAISLLKPGGRIIVSVPNVAHWSTLASLGLRGEWPSRSRGIHDRTHLRFFTRKTLYSLYAECGLDVELERRSIRLVERGTRLDHSRILSAFLDVPVWRRYFVFQYLHLLRQRAV